MLKNGTYRIQSPTGLTSEVLLFAPDGSLVGRVKKMSINMDGESPDVRGTIELVGGETHQLLRVKLSARGIIIDGDAKKDPGGSRQRDLDELLQNRS